MSEPLSSWEHHKETKDCPTCLWLSTHDSYESNSVCGNPLCRVCPQLHLLPVACLKTLESSNNQLAVTLNLSFSGIKLCVYEREQDGREIGRLKVHRCIVKYAHKYLAHVLRNGDCLSFPSMFPGYSGVVIYYNKEIQLLRTNLDPCEHLPWYVDIIDFGRADYLSEVTRPSTLVWSSFSGYSKKRLRKRHTYALWEMTENLDETKAILARKFIPEMVALILAFLQDKWYVFSAPWEHVYVDSVGAYDCKWDDYNSELEDHRFYPRLCSPEDKTIQDKHKILHTRAFTGVFHW